MKILFIHPYPPGEISSQRFRFEQYFDKLREMGIEFDLSPFYDNAMLDVIYKEGRYLKKIFGLLKGIVKRKWMFLKIWKYDFVFIHREAIPVGPPVFEWVVAKIFGKKIIYDFDDAIWLPNVSESNKLVSAVKWYSKVRNICKWAHKISCGNQYLVDYAKQFNKQVILNPTTVDTSKYHNRVKDQATDKVVIGWTGTHTTMHHLDIIVPALQELEKDHSFEFHVISNQEPDFNLQSLKYVHWTKEREIDDLMEFNIGIMPMYDNKWTKGKCGFKLLQYMALGMPALASPVSVNKEIIDEGENGYLCDTPEKWKECLIELMNDKELRAQMGKAGREKVKHTYSVESNGQNFLSLFE